MNKIIFGLLVVAIGWMGWVNRPHWSGWPIHAVATVPQVKNLAETVPHLGSQRPDVVLDQTQRLDLLKDITLDVNSGADKRRDALFQLTQLGPSAVCALQEVARSSVPDFDNQNNPEAVGAYQKKFEVSLRITALEALDKLAMSSVDIGPALAEIRRHQKNSTILFLANVSLSGILAGRPGKLSRAIDYMESQL